MYDILLYYFLRFNLISYNFSLFRYNSLFINSFNLIFLVLQRKYYLDLLIYLQKSSIFTFTFIIYYTFLEFFSLQFLKSLVFVLVLYNSYFFNFINYYFLVKSFFKYSFNTCKTSLFFYKYIYNPTLTNYLDFFISFYNLELKRYYIYIYKLSSGHSTKWLIRRLNFGINNWAKISFMYFTSSFLSSWMYQKQCYYINRIHSRKSLLWKIKNYFGPFNPYFNDFWIFGDQFSSIYLLKFVWFLKSY